MSTHQAAGRLRPSRRLLSLGRRGRRRLRVALIALTFIGIAATSLLVLLHGHRLYVVHTGSMEPTYMPGDVVIDGPAPKTLHKGEPITFFEITTAAAFLAFAEIPADAVLLEVGLGGEFDATNVIDRPTVTVITPVAMDHADKLGSTIAQIAKAKAGIIKPGVPAVVAPQQAEALEVIRARASKLRAPLVVGGEDFEAFEQN